MSNLALLSGIDLDTQYLKSSFLQSRNSFTDVVDDMMDKNKNIGRTREVYANAYMEWKGRVKKKRSKTTKLEQKSSRTSPKKKQKDAENKFLGTKIFTIAPSKAKSKGCQLDKNFIHLDEIKNQKFRRPYAEMKQVFLTGDEINYYSTKKCTKDSGEMNRKGSQFMGRPIPEHLVRNKKSGKEGFKLITE